MRSIVLAITSVVLVAVANPVLAAPSPRMAQMKSKMTEMQAKDPQGFAACQSLASSRGYRIGQQNDYEYNAVVSFIDGCLMGKQR